jgi:cullin-associated NEDD8-dissociated protein 1
LPPTSGSTPTPTALSTRIIAEIDVPIIPHSSSVIIAVLPQSTSGILLILTQVSANSNFSVPVSRSYDGYEWEKLHPLLLPVDCSIQPNCFIEIPSYTGTDNLYYIIQEYIPQGKSNEQRFAKLLLQGTYGPTLESLQDAISLGSATAWVADQINTSPTLLREHYRRRTNAYIKTDLHHHATRLACESGSRWNRHAFNRWRDVGKTIKEVSTGFGSFYLKVDGIARTEVSQRPSVTFNIPGTSYVICRKDPVVMSDFYYHTPTGDYGSLFVSTTADGCNMPISSES